jgi:hypothetical protein
MCAPVILNDGLISIAFAHLLGVVLLIGIMSINSNGVRKGMCSLFSISGGIDNIIERVTTKPSVARE